MKKINFLLTIIILLILMIPNMVEANMIRGRENNEWIKLPSQLKKSMFTNWDGYYTLDGTAQKITTSENVSFQIQYSCITTETLDIIQENSDNIPDNNEFKEWLNNYIASFIKEENWETLTSMNIEVVCKLGDPTKHDHLLFIKVIDNGTENIVWNGYGEGFTRIQVSREKPVLESIEITTPPTKINYIDGELFDNTGMVVTAKYSDGSSKIVTNYTYSPKTGLKTTDSTITITYTENNISKEATQNIKVTEKKDTTIAGGKLPQTGKKKEVLFIILAVTGMGLAFYLKYRKMKDII